MFRIQKKITAQQWLLSCNDAHGSEEIYHLARRQFTVVRNFAYKKRGFLLWNSFLSLVVTTTIGFVMKMRADGLTPYGIACIANRISEANMIRSIEDVTDPTKNSINENCARIKEDFLCHFDNEYAENYYISGFRGCAKSIPLPRKLVKWPREMKWYYSFG